jgi:hypothetical protein
MTPGRIPADPLPPDVVEGDSGDTDDDDDEPGIPVGDD